MPTLQEIESNLISALKSKNSLEADTLRALKVRIQNEKINSGNTPDSAGIEQLILSEIKRRRDSIKMYTDGGRLELAEKEQAEVDILSKFLPPQLSKEDLEKAITEILAQGSYTKTDFGKVMSLLKEKFGSSADGALLAQILKEKLI